MHALCVLPLAPQGGVFLEGLPGKDAIARCVLDVDVNVLAPHGNDHVDVDLQVMADAFFHAVAMRRCADPPALELGCREKEGDDNDPGCPDAARGSLCLIRGFCFGCR